MAVRCSIARSMRRLHLDEGDAPRGAPRARRAGGSSAPRGPCRSSRRRRRAAGSGGSGCAGTGSRRSAGQSRCRPSRTGRFPSSRHRRRCARANTRITVSSSWMRISTSAERPTVSIQNGRLMLPADLLRQRLVEQREERLRSGRRQFGRGQEIDHQAELVLRDARGSARCRRPADSRDRRRSARRCRCTTAGRQPLRHRVPVPLHEHERDHRLQDHHRRDDDQQRARIEPLRHAAL